MRKFIPLIFLINIVLVSNAQMVPGSSNHLLWRISGNGLVKPSYLFGTMHLTDKRLFQFGDSLYHALEQTEGFAAELDMNNVFSQYMNYMMSEEKEKKFINEVMDKEILKKYQAKLEKKFKKALSKITTDDLDAEEQKQTAELLQSGEMKTFMDAYLFDIAGKQGKWTGGIEDAEDQFSIKESLVPDDRIESLFTDKLSNQKQIEWMIDTYLKEDLELIDRTDRIWQGSKDMILLNRNIKMSRRIDSLAHIRSCLFAIGAAHLPGDTGVVNLLRQYGYTLTPVISSKKISPEKYTYKEIEKPWVEIVMRDSLFSLLMPVKPEPFKGLTSAAIDMQFHFDPGTYSAYFILSIPANVPTEEVKDSIINRIVRNYRLKNNNVKEKEIEIAHVKGKELVMTNEYGDFRIQIFVPGDYIAINTVFGMKKNSIDGKDPDRFFNSFKPLKTGSDTKIKNENAQTWRKVEFSDRAFAIEFPVKHFDREEGDSKESAWKRKTYDAIDMTSQVYYAVIVDETKQGFYSDKDSVYFETIRENMIELRNKAEVLRAEHTVFNGFPAYHLLLKSDEKGSAIITKMFMVNRGNRRYDLLMAYDSASAKQIPGDRFFSSFSFLPVPKGNWKEVAAPDNSFHTWAPADFDRNQDQTTPGITRYTSRDNGAVVTVLVDKEVFSNDYWVDSDSILFDERIKTFIGAGDSIIRQKKVIAGKTKGVDIDIWLAESQNIKKMRLLLNGDTLYTIFAFIPGEVIQQEEYNKLFDQFRFTHEHEPVSVFISKTAQLLEGLKTSDSANFYRRRDYLLKVRFSQKDLPLLQEALLTVYRDFDTSYYFNSSTNSILSGIVRDLDTSYSSIAFIRKNYPLLDREKEVLKPILLGLLSAQKNEEAYALLRDLITQKPPLQEQLLYFYHQMNDSLVLTKILFPDILQSIGNEAIGYPIIDLTIVLLDSNVISRQMIIDNKKFIIEKAKKEWTKPNVKSEDYSWRFLELVQLLSEINDAEANQLLRKFTRVEVTDVKLEALIGLIHNNQPVSAAEILALAKLDAARFELYDRLEKVHKLKLFPSIFMTQRWMGQSKLYEEATYDDELPEKITYIGERVAMFMGERKKFYLYKVIFNGEDPESQNLGVAGPFSLDIKNISSDHECTVLNWVASFDSKKIDQQFKELIKNIEEEKKEDKRTLIK